jgi:hypothetical protein
MSSIQSSAQILMDVLSRKNYDYTGGRGEFYNFEKAAEFANISPAKAIFVEIAKKMTRLDSLVKLIEAGQVPSNESMKDTLLDLAGYSIIAHAHLSAQEAEEDELHSYTPFK